MAESVGTTPNHVPGDKDTDRDMVLRGVAVKRPTPIAGGFAVIANDNQAASPTRSKRNSDPRLV